MWTGPAIRVLMISSWNSAGRRGKGTLSQKVHRTDWSGRVDVNRHCASVARASPGLVCSCEAKLYESWLWRVRLLGDSPRKCEGSKIRNGNCQTQLFHVSVAHDCRRIWSRVCHAPDLRRNENWPRTLVSGIGRLSACNRTLRISLLSICGTTLSPSSGEIGNASR